MDESNADSQRLHQRHPVIQISHSPNLYLFLSQVMSPHDSPPSEMNNEAHSPEPDFEDTSPSKTSIATCLRHLIPSMFSLHSRG